MDAMNRRAIMHRDLKPGNILLSYYGDFPSVNEVPGPLITFKLADFGFARFLQDGIMAETMCGSPMYMAPEVLMCQKYDARADIWSMGIIVYQCYVGKAPFYANSPEALKNIYLKTVDLRPKIPRETSPNLRDLLLKMLIRKPADRIDFPSFLAHPFLTAKHISPSDLVPHKPATVPPLPSSVRRLRGIQSAASRTPLTATTRPHFTVPTPNTRETDLPLPGRGRGQGRGRSVIADLMPTPAIKSPLGRGSRLMQPTTVPRRDPTGGGVSVSPPLLPHRPPLPPNEEVGARAKEEDSSDTSLTPTEDGDEFIEDGLGGSSFLGEVRRHVPLSTEGFGALDPCLAEVLQRPRLLDTTPAAGGGHFQPYSAAAMDRSLEGYVIVESDGSEIEHDRGVHPLLRPASQLSRRSENLPPHYRASPIPSLDDKSHIPRKFTPVSNGRLQTGKIPGTEAYCGQDSRLPAMETLANVHPAIVKLPSSSQTDISSAGTRSPLNHVSSEATDRTKHAKKTSDAPEKQVMKRSRTTSGIYMVEEAARLLAAEVAWVVTARNHRKYRFVTEYVPSFPVQASSTILQLQAARDQSGLPGSNEIIDEQLMKPEHRQEMQTVTMVLDLCELLAELAERRASALTDCTTVTTASKQVECNFENSELSPPSDSNESHPSTKLKLVPEAQRQITLEQPACVFCVAIVEQLVLYRRILYYLEYVFAQVRKAVAENRLQPTPTAKRRLTDCNALYHRCYIRLCQLSRLSRREDLLEPVGRHLSCITANRLIFNYALDQCFAAEMDDYIGELGLALQRYRAAITLIHGLCQHATSEYDKSLLAECLRMIQDRHATLWAYVAGGGCRAKEEVAERRGACCGVRSLPPPSHNAAAVAAATSR
ncbi:Serine/threonine-protein kinase unc-51 [Echinococcus granulosus]|uniref:Serine/threonine-protein kinase unc-51 n=1 Tax=Echinococcus granulosus TaxID=6210 RepID=W6UKM3_ECHGR|nr:Serine/threonine-protein kinase unc-51 [Echinococcus granulosus]EUB61633.1 Serine/threonine-protein kinase unc-51 [Echinococcus granulosus]